MMSIRLLFIIRNTHRYPHENKSNYIRHSPSTDPEAGGFIVFPVKKVQNLKCFRFRCNSTDVWHIILWSRVLKKLKHSSGQKGKY